MKKTGFLKTVIVTGAKGFVGKELVNYLNTTGKYNVISMVRNNKKDNLLPEKTVFFDLNLNIDHIKDFEGASILIHTAARVHIMKETDPNPLKIFRQLNVEATLELAQQAEKAGIKRFIFLSSIKVNGETNKNNKLFSDKDEPNPEDSYAISKKEAEEALLNFSKTSKMDVVIIRPPLIYGPGVKGNFLTLIKIFSKRIPIPFLKINNRRQFVGISNLISLIHMCMENEKASNQIFLAGDKEALSTTQWVQKIGDLLKNPPVLTPISDKIVVKFFQWMGCNSLAERLFKSLEIDLTKNEKILGWKPEFDIDYELKRTIDHFGSN